jgi:hypothetical protein
VYRYASFLDLGIRVLCILSVLSFEHRVGAMSTYELSQCQPCSKSASNRCDRYQLTSYSSITGQQCYSHQSRRETTNTYILFQYSVSAMSTVSIEFDPTRNTHVLSQHHALAISNSSSSRRRQRNKKYSHTIPQNCRISHGSPSASIRFGQRKLTSYKTRVWVSLANRCC